MLTPDSLKYAKKLFPQTILVINIVDFCRFKQNPYIFKGRKNAWISVGKIHYRKNSNLV